MKFKKGDIITVTQKEDGGWWEGTLDGRTGWFPSNYVEELARDNKPGSGVITEEVLAKNIDYRQQVSTIVDQPPDQEICSQVLRDLLEKEQEFVSDLRGLLNQYLQPLHHADM